jgi:hypothetical protein
MAVNKGVNTDMIGDSGYNAGKLHGKRHDVFQSAIESLA